MSQDKKDQQEEGSNVVQFRQVVDQEPPKPEQKEEKPRRKFEDLPPAAQRALKEAEDRRKERDALKESANRPSEVGGRGGLDPSRYDDYEIGGRTIDF